MVEWFFRITVLAAPVRLSGAPTFMKQLTDDGRLKTDPVFLSNGQDLVFTILETPVQYSLMRLTMQNGSIERLHPKATTSEFEPAFSGDGRIYAFVQSRSNLNLKLVIRHLETGKDFVFDPGGGFAGLRSPCISPNSENVVFSMPGQGGQQITIVDIRGKNKTFLTTSSGVNNWPQFSPTGEELVFGSSRNGDFDIYIMRADGSDVRRLTRSRGRDIRPVWSPDGDRIAFSGYRNGHSTICIVNRDGSGLQSLKISRERNDYPAWHPDGRHLVVVSSENGKSDLYLVAV